MNHEIDDETLIAYVDGQLDSAAGAQVKAALLRDPVLRRRAQKLQRSARALSGALDELLTEPVPTRILDVLQEAGTSSSVRRHSQVIQLAVAASLALVIGSLSGFWFANVGPSSDVAGAWPGALKVATTGLLDSTPSGAVVALTSSLELQPVLSFRDADGRVCRQYVVADTTPSGSLADGVACRDGNTRWQLEFAHLRNPPAETPTQGFTPASGGNAGTFNALVNTLVAEPITPEQERELIRSVWH